MTFMRESRGGQGVHTPPTGKSPVIWISVVNKQLDPPPPPLRPWKKLDPLTVGLPLESWKISCL